MEQQQQQTIPTYKCKSCGETMRILEKQRYQCGYSILFGCNCGARYRTHVKVEGAGKLMYQAQMK